MKLQVRFMVATMVALSTLAPAENAPPDLQTGHADLVVVGQIVKEEPVGPMIEADNLTQLFAPSQTRGLLRVDSILAGTSAGAPIWLRYGDELREHWVGESGVWLLHKQGENEDYVAERQSLSAFGLAPASSPPAMDLASRVRDSARDAHVSLSPDGSRLVTCGSQAWLWDVDHQDGIATFPVSTANATPHWLATILELGGRFYEGASGSERSSPGAAIRGYYVAKAPSSALWEAGERRLVGQLPPALYSTTYSVASDGSRVAAVDIKDVLRVFSPRGVLLSQRWDVTAATFDEHQQLVSARSGGDIEWENGSCLHLHPRGRISRIAASGAWLAVADEGQVTAIQAGEVAHCLSLPAPALELSIASRAHRLAVRCRGGQVFVFSLDSGKQLMKCRPAQEVTALRFDDTGRLRVGGRRGFSRWDLEKERVEFHDGPDRELLSEPAVSVPLAEPPNSGATVLGARAISPDGAWFAQDSGLYVNLFRMPDTSRAVHQLGRHDFLNSFLVFSPDSRTLATSNLGGGICLWDVQTGLLCRHLPESGAWGKLAYSPDGRFLAGCLGNGRVKVWDVQSGGSLRLVSYGPEWLVTDDQGHFDGSSGAERYVPRAYRGQRRGGLLRNFFRPR